MRLLLSKENTTKTSDDTTTVCRRPFTAGVWASEGNAPFHFLFANWCTMSNLIRLSFPKPYLGVLAQNLLSRGKKMTAGGASYPCRAAFIKTLTTQLWPDEAFDLPNAEEVPESSSKHRSMPQNLISEANERPGCALF